MTNIMDTINLVLNIDKLQKGHRGIQKRRLFLKRINTKELAEVK